MAKLSPGLITPRASEHEVDARVIVIMKLMISGAFREDILEYVQAQEDWPKSEAQTDNYIAKARKKLQLRGQTEVEQARGEALSMLVKLRAMAIKQSDVPAATSAQREINKLLGTYKPEQHEWKDTTDSMTDDEIDQRIAALLEEARINKAGHGAGEAAEFEAVD